MEKLATKKVASETFPLKVMDGTPFVAPLLLNIDVWLDNHDPKKTSI